MVALKVIAPELLDDPRASERFLREATQRGVDRPPERHPRATTPAKSDGITFLAMRYVEGDDVRTLVRRDGPAEPGASGADHRPGRRRARRDRTRRGSSIATSSPANVLLGPRDHVYLTDFGLAKQALSAAADRARASGSARSTTSRRSRSAASGVDARADVYALGCVLLLYCSRAAPPSPSARATRRSSGRTSSEPPPAPRDCIAGLPRDVRRGRRPRDGEGPRGPLPVRGRPRPRRASRRPSATRIRPRASAWSRVGAAAPGDDERHRRRESPPPTGRRSAASGQRTTEAPRASLAAVAAVAVIGGRCRRRAAHRVRRVRPRGSVERGDAGPRRRDASRTSGSGRTAIAVAASGVWVSSAALDRLTRLDAQTGRPRATGRSSAGPSWGSRRRGPTSGSRWRGRDGSSGSTRAATSLRPR